jgi:hypothetical protein
VRVAEDLHRRLAQQLPRLSRGCELPYASSPWPPLLQVVQVFSNMREDQRLKWYM